MGYDDMMRTLGGWSRGGGTIDDLEVEISELWVRLKSLRAEASIAREDRRRTCPAELTDLEFRFWSKVDIVDDEDSCWGWRGGRRPAPDDYGQFRWVDPFTGKNEVTGAHRVALFLATGEAPLFALHSCDWPPCVRPGHLRSGTHAENMQDKVDRGRSRGKRDQRGETNDSAVLTDALVIDARRRVRAGERTTTLAREYGVQHPTLSYAVTGKTWIHLDAVETPVAGRRGGPKISASEHDAIRAAYAAGTTGRDLAKRYGVTPSLISKIVHRTSS